MTTTTALTSLQVGHTMTTTTALTFLQVGHCQHVAHLAQNFAGAFNLQFAPPTQQKAHTHFIIKARLADKLANDVGARHLRGGYAIRKTEGTSYTATKEGAGTVLVPQGFAARRNSA